VGLTEETIEKGGFFLYKWGIFDVKWEQKN
jgi:hypothetical protein